MTDFSGLIGRNRNLLLCKRETASGSSSPTPHFKAVNTNVNCEYMEHTYDDLKIYLDKRTWYSVLSSQHVLFLLN